MILIFDMALLSQYERYQECIFTERSLKYVGWFYAENSKSLKNYFCRVFTSAWSGKKEVPVLIRPPPQKVISFYLIVCLFTYLCKITKCVLIIRNVCIVPQSINN